MDRVDWQMRCITLHYTGEVFSPLLTSSVRPSVCSVADASGSDGPCHLVTLSSCHLVIFETGRSCPPNFVNPNRYLNGFAWIITAIHGLWGGGGGG
jgi:hypothetical protein